MEAFEKWLNKERPTQDYKWEMVNFSWGSQAGWRACLEWIKKISKDGHTLEMCSIEDIIEEELEGKIEEEKLISYHGEVPE